MQKDNENAGAEQIFTAETEKTVNNEEVSAPAKKNPSAKKSPSKKSTASASKTSKKSNSTASGAAKKSATAKKDTASSKKTAVKKTDKTEKSVSEEKTDILNAAEEKTNEPAVTEEISSNEIHDVDLPSSNENNEDSETIEKIDDDSESQFIIPETAAFTISDTDGEGISIIGDLETENSNGLLNVEHFSDYKSMFKDVSEPTPYYESEGSFEENITILAEESATPKPTVKKEKYEDPDRENYDPKKPRKIDARFDFIELFVFTLLAVILLTTFIFRHAVVEGPSMQNTLQDGEHLIISNLFYTPKKGDIIVCQDRETGHYEPIVKRVIATSGDTIEIIDSVVYLNGEKLYEDYVFIDGVDHYSDFPEVTVPEDMIFVMGDHRNNSGDSRAFITTFVREDAVLGKVVLRFYPFDKFGSVD